MKKLFKFILVLLLIIIVAIVAFVIALYDSKDVTNYEVIDRETPAQLIFNNALYDGTYDVSNSKEAELLFTESQLEALLYPIVMSLNQDGLNFEITGVDVDVKKGQYYFEASVNVSKIFKSVITANIEILNENESFIISLKNLKLGAISVTKIGNYLVKNIDNEKLQNSLHNQGFNIDIDLQKFSITCTYDNIKNIINNKVDSKQGSLITLLFDVFLTNEQFMDISLGENDLLGVYAHLSSAEFNETLEGGLQYNYSFDDIANDIKKLLDDNLMTYRHTNVVFNYLVRGYDSLDEEDQTVIDDIDVSSIVSDKKQYKGIIEKSEVTLMDYMTDIFNNKSIFELSSILNEGITISDTFLTSLLQSFDYMGYSFAYSNEENKVGYFVLEQLNLNCKDQLIDIHIVMNFNGLRIYLEASFDCLDNNSNGLKINGTIKDVKIGEYVLTEQQKQLLIAYLGDLLESLDWINIDSNTFGICLDFSNAMLSIISNNSLLNTLIGDSINNITKTYIEDGKVSLKFSLINN